MTFDVRGFEKDIAAVLAQIREQNIPARIWQRDHTVWKPDPDEITNRLSWLDSPVDMQPVVAEIERFAASVRSAGYKKAILLGMGGSSLAPEVFYMIFGRKEGFLDLAVLDSTSPETVRRFEDEMDPKHTLFIAATKSGTTAETLSFLKYFYRLIGERNPGAVGDSFIAITDPGTPLEKLAADWKFRQTFLNDKNIGGRFSALSYFGLVPAALVGVDIRLILQRAAAAAELSRGAEADENLLKLGVTAGVLARKFNRDKLTFLMSPALAPFGPWLEQLFAESLGKSATGILPVIGEEDLDPSDFSDDRLFVSMSLESESTRADLIAALIKNGQPVIQIRLDDVYDLGGEFFRWEFATCIAGHLLGVQPFDQPDVESAKKLARRSIETYTSSGKKPQEKPAFAENGIRVFADTAATSVRDALDEFLAPATARIKDAPHPYVCLQAFLSPGPELDALLQQMRLKIAKKYRVATTSGYGPRFLHSTGQLHKGDAGNGLFIQITADSELDFVIPEMEDPALYPLTFATLISAQALGDFQALREKNRRVIRFHLENAANDLSRLSRAV